VDIIAVQELLGHSWISTTMRYVNPQELHQTGENLQVAC
jgi:site-specific recombinase XerD